MMLVSWRAERHANAPLPGYAASRRTTPRCVESGGPLALAPATAKKSGGTGVAINRSCPQASRFQPTTASCCGPFPPQPSPDSIGPAVVLISTAAPRRDPRSRRTNSDSSRGAGQSYTGGKLAGLIGWSTAVIFSPSPTNPDDLQPIIRGLRYQQRWPAPP